MIDTVAIAATTPDTGQPFAELGLKPDEYARIREILGRRPTSSELAMYSVMWSEHCSYKSSKVHLRQFGEKKPATDALLVGMGENAGVVDIGDGWAVTFKVESHNHPSYVEPYQGAATGVGGIVRDIMSMGARPVAVMDPLRFGAADHPDTRRVLPGVVAGIGGYGNCLGLPNIGGEVVFDAVYQGNPLVNALCVGVMKHEDIHLASAHGVGNLVVLYGARTGGDGIGGASILASDTFSEGGPTKRPAVQVGDPFMEKLLIECTLEVLRAGLVEGIQDLGAAGISCATSELASNGEGGMHVVLDRVPLRDHTLSPEEILMSESQERMAAVVRPDRIDAFLAICAKWEIEAAIVGEVNDSGRLTIEWRGEQIVDVPPRTVAHEGPVYERPLARPGWLTPRQDDAPTPERLARPGSAAQLREAVLQLAASPNLAAKDWVTEQYDRYVQGNTVLAMPEDAGVLRVDEVTGRGVALSTDCNGRFAALDPYAGAQLAYAEAYRNVAVTGAVPLAVTNCLNFGSPEDPAVMWQFAQAVSGLADACQRMGTPVTGGNVSFYNQTGDVAIHPTPVVGVLGVLDDVARRTPMAWSTDGDLIYLLGVTRDEFGGSEWAHVVHDHLGGMPPHLDLDAERTLGQILVAGSRDGLFSAAHDVSDGGVVLALLEMALRAGVGARCWVPDDLDPFVFLLAESATRAIVAVPRSEELRFAEMCGARGFAAARIGVVDSGIGADAGVPGGGQALVVDGVHGEALVLALDEVRAAREATFPALFGEDGAHGG
ncbi:MAG: phosphoribosylformylglycinamidine synthase subunit PurL [Candidatus Nanopelagicales bacterium]|jgi:phosphoribosylformylglycinamidine synthase|nr:phosphoribosylformylglycinamidine synthase subunit PurL [Candidatus Nanopelagicales bacterium]